MSEEQLSALLARLNEDAGLREKLKGAGEIDAALAIAKDAGFDVCKEDWLRHQVQQTAELSDEELEGVSGGLNEGNRGGNNCYVLCSAIGYTR
jgi:predicted ribosomally synthesized peptide with nif11-like leader